MLSNPKPCSCIAIFLARPPRSLGGVRDSRSCAERPEHPGPPARRPLPPHGHVHRGTRTHTHTRLLSWLRQAGSAGYLTKDLFFCPYVVFFLLLFFFFFLFSLELVFQQRLAPSPLGTRPASPLSKSSPPHGAPAPSHELCCGSRDFGKEGRLHPCRKRHAFSGPAKCQKKLPRVTEQFV